MRTPKPLPSKETLNALLHYKPETGKLYWKARPLNYFLSEANFQTWNKQFAEKEAFTSISNAGYHQGHLLGVHYLAHRVIWKLLHGEDPISIDHKNGVTTDNHPTNLRSVTHTRNHQNRALGKNNTSGCFGVGFNRRRGKWYAAIKVDGSALHLGVFVNVEDAITARKRAEEDHRFHKNHGRDAVWADRPGLGKTLIDKFIAKTDAERGVVPAAVVKPKVVEMDWEAGL